MAFTQGLVSGTDIPVEHLDYDYIGKCSKSSEVEKLLKILRSNKEGHYPDLIKFTEDRLAKLNPNSKLLIKTEPARQLKDLPNKDGLMADLEQWEQQVSGEEASLQTTPLGDNPPLLNGEEEELPPIRKAGNIVGSKAESKGERKRAVGSGQKIKSADYRSWDKLDVEKECAKVDQEPPVEDHSRNGDHTHNPMPAKLSESELSMSAAEKKRAAVREKDKGNEAFRAGDYEEAISYYSRSILLEDSAPSYNNRAITLIKLQRYKEALQDCAKVLQLEPTNTKALLRRGTALVSLKEWREAESAVETLLKLEPKNKRAQEMLSQARKELGQAKKKGRRVQIEEVEEEEGNDGSAAATPTNSVTNTGIPPQAPPPTEVAVATAPMPEDVKQWKEKGNDLFRRGQYAEAVEIYSKAVDRLRKAGDGHKVSLSTILNNRAACHLKNGNTRACVEDCTLSLQLVPVNLKALMRRAKAYEYMDKYRLAFVDNQMALTLDRSLDTVYAANNRLRKLLEDQDGYHWKDKLPRHPQQDSITEALRQNASFTSSTTGTSESTSTNATDTSESTNTTDGANTSEGAAIPPPPSITTSTASTAANTTTNVTQVATPISTTAPSSPPAKPTEPTSTQKFETAKAQGNEHVKKGRYVEALNCYSLCIDACPDHVVGYTNRALCHLKLGSPGSAEQDCSKALELDSANIKALYRRAMARKTLKKYGDSMKDLKQLLLMDAENSAAKGEYVEVKRLWEKQLREMQASTQQQQQQQPQQQRGGGKPTSSSKKKQPNQQKAKTHAAAKGKGPREMSQQQRELEQLLEETKSRVKQLKENPMGFTDPAASESASKYLNPSKTTYYKNQQPQAQAKPSSAKPPSAKSSSAKPPSTKPPSSSSLPTSQPTAQQATPSQGKAQPSSSRRRKVVVEEEVVSEGAEVEEGRSGAEKQDQQQTQAQEQSTRVQREKQLTKAQGSGAEKQLAEVQGEKKSGESGAEKQSVESAGEKSVQGGEQSGGEKQPSKVQGEQSVENGGEKSVQELGGEKQPVQVKNSNEVTPSHANKHSDGVLSSHYEFVQRWNSIARGGSSEECADLLQKIPPERLPEIITNQLDGAMLSSIVKAISRQFLPKKHFKLSLDILENLSKVPRFQTIAMFLDKQEVTELAAVFIAMEKDMDKATIQNLKRLYGVKT